MHVRTYIATYVHICIRSCSSLCTYVLTCTKFNVATYVRSCVCMYVSARRKISFDCLSSYTVQLDLNFKKTRMHEPKNIRYVSACAREGDDVSNTHGE